MRQHLQLAHPTNERSRHMRLPASTSSSTTFTPAYRIQPRHSSLIDLFSQPTPEPHYAVSALIPAGITVLGSRSLTHLTTLAVSLSISISLGESALTRLPAS